MPESLPDIPAGSTVRQNTDGSWWYLPQVGPWLPMPDPQGAAPWADGPAVQSREPAAVAAEARPLSPDTRAVLEAIDGYDTPRITVAQAFRALAFLRPIETLAPAQLIRIAEELDP